MIIFLCYLSAFSLFTVELGLPVMLTLIDLLRVSILGLLILLIITFINAIGLAIIHLEKYHVSVR